MSSLQFPAEVWQLIANQLKPPDYHTLSIASKSIRQKVSDPVYWVYRRRYRELIRHCPDFPLFQRHLDKKLALYASLACSDGSERRREEGQDRHALLMHQLKERFGVVLVLAARYGALTIVKAILERTHIPWDTELKICVFLWSLESIDGDGGKTVEVARYLFDQWKDSFGDFFGVVLVNTAMDSDRKRFEMLLDIYGKEADRNFQGFDLEAFYTVSEFEHPDGHHRPPPPAPHHHDHPPNVFARTPHPGTQMGVQDLTRTLLYGSDSDDPDDSTTQTNPNDDDQDSYFGDEMMDWVLTMQEQEASHQFWDRRQTMAQHQLENADYPPTWKDVALWEAIADHQKGMTEFLVKELKFNVTGGMNYALLLAIQHHQTDVCRLLLEHGADPNARDSLVFCEVVESGEWPLIRMFVEYGADVNGDEDEPLLCAIRATRIQPPLALVRYLVEQGADPRLDDDEPLFTAALMNKVDICQYLIQQGANVHSREDSLLWLVSRRGHTEMVRYLFEQGAVYRPHPIQNDFELCDTPEEAYEGTVRLLLEKGVKPRQFHPLIYQMAMMRRYKSVLKLLIEADPEHFHSRVEQMDPIFSDPVLPW